MENDSIEYWTEMLEHTTGKTEEARQIIENGSAAEKAKALIDFDVLTTQTTMYVVRLRNAVEREKRNHKRFWQR